MPLPDFLKRENREPVDPIIAEFLKVREAYENFFKEKVMIEPYSRSMEEWIELLNACLKEKKTYLELTGEQIEDVLY